MKTCATCRFWKLWTHQPTSQDANVLYGDCHRRAPICHPGPTPSMARTKFPSVSNRDFCGEHEEKKP